MQKIMLFLTITMLANTMSTHCMQYNQIKNIASKNKKSKKLSLRIVIPIQKKAPAQLLADKSQELSMVDEKLSSRVRIHIVPKQSNCIEKKTPNVSYKSFIIQNGLVPLMPSNRATIGPKTISCTHPAPVQPIRQSFNIESLGANTTPVQDQDNEAFTSKKIE